MPKQTVKKETMLSEHIMKQIHERHITMRSRWYFIVGSIVFGVGLTAAIVLAFFFLSVVIFRLNAYGHWEYLRLGRRGMQAFSDSFPWITLLITVGGLSVGIALLKKLDISYRRGYFAVAASMIFAIIAASSLIGIYGFDTLDQFPRFSSYLHHNQTMGSNWVVGEIITITDNTITILSPREEEIEVNVDETTLIPHGGQLTLGQRIRAVGEWNDGIFNADGIGRGGMNWRHHHNGKHHQNMRMQ